MHLHHLNQNDSGKLGFLAYTLDIDGNRKFQYFEFNENHESTPIERIRKLNLNPPYNSMIFVGSCNGLICLAANHHPSVCISNPITRECVMLPELQRDFSCDIGETINFGYVSSNNEYKVLRTFLLKTKMIDVYMYTLGSGDGWRNIGKFDFGSSKPWEQGVFANGALYWLDTEMKMIIKFDLDEEKFCEHLSLPLSPPDHWVYNVGVLDGFLSFTVVIGMVENLDMAETIYSHIWLYKKRTDNHDKKEGEEHHPLVWRKEFRLKISDPLLTITKRSGLLTWNDHDLYLYDRKTSTSESLVEFKDRFLQVSPHKNTLVSLKKLGEEDTKTMESVEIEETRSLDYRFKLLQKDANPECIYS